MDQTVEFTYRLTGTGWSKATLAFGENTTTLTASYLEDALGDLLRAVIAIMTGTSEIRVHWVEEPAEHRLILERRADSVHLTIRRYPDFDSRSAPDAWGDRIFEGSCPLDTLGKAIANGAQHVLDQYGSDGYQQLWTAHPFPSEALSELQALSSS